MATVDILREKTYVVKERLENTFELLRRALGAKENVNFQYLEEYLQHLENIDQSLQMWFVFFNQQPQNNIKEQYYQSQPQPQQRQQPYKKQEVTPQQQKITKNEIKKQTPIIQKSSIKNAPSQTLKIPPSKDITYMSDRHDIDFSPQKLFGGFNISPPKTPLLRPGERMLSPIPNSPKFDSPPRTVKVLSPSTVRKKREFLNYYKDDENLTRNYDEYMQNEHIYFNEDGPVQEFDLALFPEIFQEGDGAYQLTELYSLFLYNKDEGFEAPCLTFEDLTMNLDGFDEELILILLELLVSKRILKCITINNVKHWTSREEK